MSFRCDRVPGLPFFDTLQLQKKINAKHSKILFNVFLMYQKSLENEAPKEINCQLNSKKSRNFPRNALVAGTF